MLISQWLLDCLQDKRKALLDRFYTNFDAATYNEVLADSFTMRERLDGSTSYGKQGEPHQVIELARAILPP